MSNIEWTDETWNPTVGCTKVSPGCKNCYAEKMHARLSDMGQKKYYGGFNHVKPWPEALGLPLRWRKPRRVFVNSMSDLFHHDIPREFISRVFGVMAACERHIFQILTKRAQLMSLFMRRGEEIVEPLPNVWLGVSVEDQPRLDERVQHLLQTPAAVRFLSCEPLLGLVDLRHVQTDMVEIDTLTGDHGVLRPLAGRGDGVDWVIVGAESGSGARPMDFDWARSIVQQCKDASVPVFVKQLCTNGRKIPFEEWPDDLRVREWPA